MPAESASQLPFSELVDRAIADQSLSLTEVARRVDNAAGVEGERLDTSKQQVHRWRRGPQVPQPQTVRWLAVALNQPIKDLAAAAERQRRLLSGDAAPGEALVADPSAPQTIPGQGTPISLTADHAAGPHAATLSAAGLRALSDPAELIAEQRKRDLKVGQFVAWIADHSRLSFQEAYGAVAEDVEGLTARDPADRYAEAHRRTKITRAQLARALIAYYQDSLPHELGATFYRARVGGMPLALSILARPDWIGTAARLGTDHERFQLASPDVGAAVRLPEGRPLEAALRRLAMVETSATVMVNNPLYRLQDLTLSRQRLKATVSLTHFADYALTMDLLETELVDALAADQSDGRGGLPLRDVYLPTVASALSFSDRLCVGGPVALMAAARPGTRHGEREPDYVLLVQERSARVLNVTGRLAVVPKAFHGPTTEAAEEAHLSASLERELEEELLGREDLEQVSERSFRRVDPFAADQLSEPMRWLAERRQTDAYRVECIGFGINMVSGNYEFPCLIVIDDEQWWQRYSGQIEANWEMARVRRYSSRDTAGLQALAADPRWSNEGLFAFIEGLRRLAELDTVSRVALPEIEVGA